MILLLKAVEPIATTSERWVLLYIETVAQSPPPADAGRHPRTTGKKGPHKGLQFRPFWLTFLCTMRSTAGWAGSSRAASASVKPTIVSCIVRPRPRAKRCMLPSPSGWRRWASSSTRTRRASSTAKTASAGGTTSTPASPSRVHLPGTEGAEPRTGAYFTSFVPAMSPEALKAKGAELRSMRVHRRTTSPGRPGPVAEPHRRRVDELLRPVLPDGDVTPSSSASIPT